MVSGTFRYITLDWDWSCHDFEPSNSRLFQQIISDNRVKRVWMRCSAHGKIHLYIELSESVDFWESLYLRSIWDDDANRIRMDIIRFWEDGEVMRLWDSKADCIVKENGKIDCVFLRAGEWKLIYER
jgi:hypothetical protein